MVVAVSRHCGGTQDEEQSATGIDLHYVVPYSRDLVAMREVKRPSQCRNGSVCFIVQMQPVTVRRASSTRYSVE